jgi:CubicO group peptidase (beta-lactamase class C family)
MEGSGQDGLLATAGSRRVFVEPTVGSLAAAALAESALRPVPAAAAAAPGVAAPGVAAPGVAAPGVAAPGVAAPRMAALRTAERASAPGARDAARARVLFEWLDEKIAAGMSERLIPGAAVAVYYRGHEHVRGFGITDTRHPVPVDPNTLFRIGSTSKTFTGTAAMRLVDSGDLNLDSEVTRYLPEFRAPDGARDVTVRELLNHSPGWLGDDFYDTGRGWDALPKYVARMAGLPQLTPVGSVFSYNNAAIALAGQVVGQIAGATYESAIRDLVLRPLGLGHTFYFSDEVIGYNIAASHFVADGRAVAEPRAWHVPRSINAASGLMSSASDQLRYARFHLGDGRAPDGTRLLSKAALEGMRSDPGPGGTLVVELAGMGVSWMLRPSAQGMRIVQHGGHWPGQVSGFLMVPGQEFAMTLLTNCESGSALVNELFAADGALRLFTGLSNLPARQRCLSRADLRPYEGRYLDQRVDFAGRLVANAPQTVTAHDGELLLTRGEGRAARHTILTFYDSPFGRDYVLVKDGDGTPRGTRANFVRDQAGQVRWLRLGGRLHRRMS